MALAGTCSADQPEDDFLEDNKEQREHQLVIMGISGAFRGVGTVRLAPLKLLRLPHLSHLMTPIEISLHNAFDFNSVVHFIHPTPALGAYPREKGKEWLHGYDKHTPRTFYGAPFGFHQPSNGLSRCLVGIRNVQWDSHGMRIAAGCGVVKGSCIDKELREIQLKIKAIKNQFQL